MEKLTNNWKYVGSAESSLSMRSVIGYTSSQKSDPESFSRQKILEKVSTSYSYPIKYYHDWGIKLLHHISISHELELLNLLSIIKDDMTRIFWCILQRTLHYMEVVHALRKICIRWEHATVNYQMLENNLLQELTQPIKN